MLEYQSISALCAAAEEAGVSLSELVLRDQAEEMELPTEVLYQRMRENLQVMRQAIQAGSMPETRSLSGLTGGDAFKMKRYAQEGGIIGGFMNRSIARALAVSEYNAAMGESCGVSHSGLLRHPAGHSGFYAGRGKVYRGSRCDGSLHGWRCGHGDCPAGLDCRGAGGDVRPSAVQPPPWRQRPLWSCAAAPRPKRATPAPWPSKTSWGWCVTPWRVWWRFPVSSAMFPGYPLPLPQRKWPWRELRARFRWTNVSRR